MAMVMVKSKVANMLGLETTRVEGYGKKSRRVSIMTISVVPSVVRVVYSLAFRAHVHLLLGPFFSELFPVMDHPVVSNGPVDPANHIQHLVKGTECLEGGIERLRRFPTLTATAEKANSWASAEHRS